MKIFYKRSIWVMLTVYLILWLIVTLVAGNVLESYKKVINTTRQNFDTEIIQELFIFLMK